MCRICEYAGIVNDNDAWKPQADLECLIPPVNNATRLALQTLRWARLTPLQPALSRWSITCALYLPIFDSAWLSSHGGVLRIMYTRYLQSMYTWSLDISFYGQKERTFPSLSSWRPGTFSVCTAALLVSDHPTHTGHSYNAQCPEPSPHDDSTREVRDTSLRTRRGTRRGGHIRRRR